MDDPAAAAPDPRPPFPAATPARSPEEIIRRRLGRRAIVLVGLMGAGKSTIGRRLASRLQLPFKDADQEIEAAANMTVADIFAAHGEPYFRSGEQRVIARLLGDGPLVLATGGGAFMNADTRAQIKEAGLSVWLRADLDVLLRRVRRRSNRPLLRADPERVMRELMGARHPVYALADLVVESREAPHESVAADAIAAIAAHLAAEG